MICLDVGGPSAQFCREASGTSHPGKHHRHQESRPKQRALLEHFRRRLVQCLQHLSQHQRSLHPSAVSRRPGHEEKDEGTERETGTPAVLRPTAPSVPSALRPVPGRRQRFQASNSSEEVVNTSALGHRLPLRQCTVAYLWAGRQQLVMEVEQQFNSSEEVVNGSAPQRCGPQISPGKVHSGLPQIRSATALCGGWTTIALRKSEQWLSSDSEKVRSKHMRFKRALFIRTEHHMQIFRVTPLYQTTKWHLKQWKIRCRTLTCFWLSELCCFHVQCWTSVLKESEQLSI